MNSRGIIVIFCLLLVLVRGVPIDQQSFCAICLSEIEEKIGGEIRLGCSHSFHRDCLVSWFREDRAATGRRCNCPTCRKAVPLTFISEHGIDPDADLNLFNSTVAALVSTYYEVRELKTHNLRSYMAWDDLLDTVGEYSDEDIRMLEMYVKRAYLLDSLEKKTVSAVLSPRFKEYFDPDDDDDDDDDDEQ